MRSTSECLRARTHRPHPAATNSTKPISQQSVPSVVLRHPLPSRARRLAAVAQQQRERKQYDAAAENRNQNKQQTHQLSELLLLPRVHTNTDTHTEPLKSATTTTNNSPAPSAPLHPNMSPMIYILFRLLMREHLAPSPFLIVIVTPKRTHNNQNKAKCPPSFYLSLPTNVPSPLPTPFHFDLFSPPRNLPLSKSPFCINPHRVIKHMK